VAYDAHLANCSLSTTHSYTTWHAVTATCLQKRIKLWIS